MTWSGVISGLGSLVVDGGGQPVLSGANTYKGGTKVSGPVVHRRRQPGRRWHRDHVEWRWRDRNDQGRGHRPRQPLRLGWQHEFADTARPISASFAAAPGPQFTVYGATPQRDSAVIGFSAATAINDRVSLFASYEGDVGGGTDNHQLMAGLRLTW